MVHLLRSSLSIPSLRRHRENTRHEESQERSTTFGLSSCKASSHPSILPTYTNIDSQWLLSRRQRATYDPAFRQPQVYYAVYPQGQQPPNSYNMYPMPPPVYDPNSAPPNYQPPLGGTKVDPIQGAQISGVTQPVASQSTGASNNPYRQ